MLEKAKSGELKAVNGSAASQAAAAKRKRRWDQTADHTPSNTTPRKVSSWDQADGGSDVSQCSLTAVGLQQTIILIDYFFN